MGALVILAIGSSSTEGVGASSPGAAYPARLEHESPSLVFLGETRPCAPRRYVRGSDGLVRPNLGTHELTRVARADRAEPHAKEDGPWTTIA